MRIVWTGPTVRDMAAFASLLPFPEMGRPGRKAGTRELVANRTPYIAAGLMPRGERAAVDDAHPPIESLPGPSAGTRARIMAARPSLIETSFGMAALPTSVYRLAPHIAGDTRPPALCLTEPL